MNKVYSEIVIKLIKLAHNDDDIKILLLEKMDKIFFKNMENPLIVSDFLTVQKKQKNILLFSRVN